MNPTDPLTPEERALARLLGRGAPTAPSAALDEAVLAAARAAVQSPPVAHAVDNGETPAAAPSQHRPRAPRSRLPAALGLAASVVFAVGIAWQLKPEAPQPPPSEAAAVAMEAAPVADAVPAAAAAAASDSARDGAAAAAPAPMAERPAPSPLQKRAVAAPVPMPPEPAPVKPAQAAPIATAPVAAPAPAAAPPPPADAYSMDMAAPQAAERAPDARARQQAAQPAATSTGSAGAPGLMRRAAPMASGALSASAVDTAVAADAALPRTQWLKRIRERRDAGDLDTARASLEQYLQQYPEARVPRDIRQLLDN